MAYGATIENDRHEFIEVSLVDPSGLLTVRLVGYGELDDKEKVVISAFEREQVEAIHATLAAVLKLMKQRTSDG